MHCCSGRICTCWVSGCWIAAIGLCRFDLSSSSCSGILNGMIESYIKTLWCKKASLKLLPTNKPKYMYKFKYRYIQQTVKTQISPLYASCLGTFHYFTQIAFELWGCKPRSTGEFPSFFHSRDIPNRTLNPDGVLIRYDTLHKDRNGCLHWWLHG